ncbi:DUF2239 family protein [Variovorax dokdonensis]|uniref:DUF2239 family protein n=1 Tax=Variovorax dokdonensis TaxID=344883 RepID=A0ABT7NGT9_9BURK|nr:DUF2239 family protein [Variovorax dokdonensis]MDM0047138.1 DUF2239 family protein [Variovorax dokdonensis]
MSTEPAQETELADPAVRQLSAFAGLSRVDAGPEPELIARLRAAPPEPDVLLRIFDDATGERLELDLRPEGGATALPPPAPAPRSVGRPRLGVVAREVTLLPRHWEWLNRQPGGASAALRRLVDEARQVHRERDAQRAAQETTYRVMKEMAGDLPGFEEASRALFAGEAERFDRLVEAWPDDLKAYLRRLALGAWTSQ